MKKQTKISEKSRKISVKLSAAEAMVLSEQLNQLAYLKLPINAHNTVLAVLIIDFFERNLNKIFFKESLNVIFTYAEAIAFFQFYAGTKHELIESICYSLADILIQKGVCLSGKN